MLRLFVLIATINRSALLERTIASLSDQRRRPDGIVVAATSPHDVRGIERSPLAPRSSSRSGARADSDDIAAIGDCADVVLFLDDDFIADDYLLELEQLFEQRPDVVGATGRVVADGVRSGGLSFSQGTALLEADRPPTHGVLERVRGLYGCNMAVRMAAARNLRFDETLPLYGWFEDIDYSSRLGRKGLLLRSNRLRGVHLGDGNGRTGGLRLGYSQIANIVYLLRKRTVPRKLAWRMMLGNVAANLVKSISPEAYVDRRGRLRGNVLALRHLMTDRLDPRFILDLD